MGKILNIHMHDGMQHKLQKRPTEAAYRGLARISTQSEIYCWLSASKPHYAFTEYMATLDALC